MTLASFRASNKPNYPKSTESFQPYGGIVESPSSENKAKKRINPGGNDSIVIIFVGKAKRSHVLSTLFDF